MPDAIGLVCSSLHQVYILPEDSADSEHPVYLWIPMYYWRAGPSGRKRRFFARRASAHASILRYATRRWITERERRIS